MWEWKKSRINLVQITGGEPLLQHQVYSLIDGLMGMGAKVLLETNGSLSVRDVPSKVIKVIDRKTPGSGERQAWCEENLRYLGRQDQVKFVITGREDYLWSKKEVSSLYLNCYSQVIFSPAWEMLSPSELAKWIIDDKLNVRFQLQIHKVLWGEKKESVFFNRVVDIGK